MENLERNYGENMLKGLSVVAIVLASSIAMAAAPGKRVAQTKTTGYETTATTTRTVAPPAPGERHGQFHFGLGAGAPNVGFDYLLKLEPNVEAGGYLLYMGYKEKDGVPVRGGLFGVGAVAKVHYVTGDWDMYIAPGFGLAALKYSIASSEQTETTVGPIFRTGVLKKMSERISAGLEAGFVYNMFNQEIGALGDPTMGFSNFTMRFWF